MTQPSQPCVQGRVCLLWGNPRVDVYELITHYPQRGEWNGADALFCLNIFLIPVVCYVPANKSLRQGLEAA